MTTKSLDPNRVGPTPLTERMGPLNHGNKWHSWRGLHIPDTYEGLSPELKALHQRAVVEDKSPMNYYSISGPDAAALLDRLVTRDITRVEVGAGVYTPWLNDDGKVVIDTPVFRLGEFHYVTMGGILTDWLAAHTTGYDVTVGDQSDETMVMPVQGPASRGIIQAATGEDWTGTRFMRGRPTKIGAASVWVWRAGYNPQLGFEVHMDRRDAIAVFDAVVAAGEGLRSGAHRAERRAGRSHRGRSDRPGHRLHPCGHRPPDRQLRASGRQRAGLALRDRPRPVRGLWEVS